MSARTVTHSKRKKKKQWRELTCEEKEELFKDTYKNINVWWRGKLVMKDEKLVGKEGEQWRKWWLSQKIRRTQPVGGEYD